MERKFWSGRPRKLVARLFEAAKKQTVAQIYDQIAEELCAHYRLGYTPIMSRLLPDRPDYP
jgi:hypothetical protein